LAFYIFYDFFSPVWGRRVGHLRSSRSWIMVMPAII